MSLALCIAARGRLREEAARDGRPLAAWLAEHELAALRVGVGYRRPTSAQDWPFLALLPARDRRSMVHAKGADVRIALVAGYRLPSVGRGDDDDDGLLAVDALAEAALEALRMPWTADWARRTWHASVAERVDAQYAHPHYEIELSVSFGSPGLETRA